MGCLPGSHPSEEVGVPGDAEQQWKGEVSQPALQQERVCTAWDTVGVPFGHVSHSSGCSSAEGWAAPEQSPHDVVASSLSGHFNSSSLLTGFKKNMVETG